MVRCVAPSRQGSLRCGGTTPMAAVSTYVFTSTTAQDRQAAAPGARASAGTALRCSTRAGPNCGGRRRFHRLSGPIYFLKANAKHNRDVLNPPPSACIPVISQAAAVLFSFSTSLMDRLC
ncbi:hypothetical protein P154DRAFT_110387 [Amniculicola lignicola CBS 123094]|uniref:Uncharacterized protein n=1 Tax=Amniculicola lignicola CBS 123094 TaxID=1392246 RepID=A0A6A5WMK6_9PLEO|nr:hypothetical protein P154DRAFT_110387 [Amniculicola lignicola CBS 123094]